MRARLIRAAAGSAVIGALLAAGQPAGAAAAADVPCSVPALVLAMKTAASGTTLSLAPGCVYSLTESLPPVRRDLIVEGNHATLARSQAPATPAFSILRADAGALAVSALNFRNGRRAITVAGTATLTVTGGTFSGNSAVNGGAILDRSDGDGPKVTGTLFRANSATGSGGAIFNISGQAGVNLSHAIFAGNTAGNGGAIYDFSVDGQHVRSSVFSDNQAAACGALCLFSGSSMRLTDIVVRGNSATGGGGGGVSATANQGVQIDGGLISGNHAAGLAGGLYLDALWIRITGTVIEGNSASDGAGLYGSAEQMSLIRVTVSDNHASGYGGGVYNDWSGQASPSSHAADDSQIVGNRAGAGGGGIYDAVNGTFALRNTRVRGNVPDDCEPAASVTGCGG